MNTDDGFIFKKRFVGKGQAAILCTKTQLLLNDFCFVFCRALSSGDYAILFGRGAGIIKAFID